MVGSDVYTGNSLHAFCASLDMVRAPIACSRECWLGASWSGTQWWADMCPTGMGHARDGIIAALTTRCMEPQCKGRRFSPM
jgi:hypothetical protein